MILIKNSYLKIISLFLIAHLITPNLLLADPLLSPQEPNSNQPSKSITPPDQSSAAGDLVNPVGSPIESPISSTGTSASILPFDGSLEINSGADSTENSEVNLTLNGIGGKLRGDSNEDGNVDAADYVLWRKGNLMADFDKDGQVTSSDYSIWRAFFGMTNIGNSNALIEMSFSFDSQNFGPWETYQTTKTIALPSGSGVKTVYVKFRDFFGNESEAFSDSINLVSQTPNVNVTYHNDAHHDTAQAKFGVSSLRLDGSGDFLSIADSEDWDFGTGDFTIDFWTKPASVSGSQIFIDRNNGLQFAIQKSPDGYLQVLLGGAIISEGLWSPVVDTWYHVAVTRSSGVLRIFVNGSQLGSDRANTVDINGSTGVNIGTNLADEHSVNGWMDEVRISKGSARWVANFTPPTQEHTPDQNAVLLLHFDTEVQGPDRVAPIGTVSINAGNELTNNPEVTLALTVHDDRSSENAIQMSFSQDGINFSAFEPFSANKIINLEGGNGVKTITIRFRDEAGNIGTYSDSIELNTTVAIPENRVLINQGNISTFSNQVTLNLSALNPVGLQMAFSQDGGQTFSPFEAFNSTKQLILTGNDGFKEIVVRYRNQLGELADFRDSIYFEQIAPVGSYFTSKYFPLRTSNFWSYVGNTSPLRVDIVGTRVINGQITFIQRYSGADSYYTSDANGVRLHGFSEGGQEFLFTQPLTEVPNLISNGQTYTDVKTNVYQGVPVTFTATSVVLAQQNITAANGAVFRNALHIRTTLSDSLTGTSETIEYWYHRNLGVIQFSKQTGINKINEGVAHYPSGRKHAQLFTTPQAMNQPVPANFIYVEYYDENFNGTGVGRVFKRQKLDGSFELLEYHQATSNIKRLERYDSNGNLTQAIEYSLTGVISQASLPDGTFFTYDGAGKLRLIRTPTNEEFNYTNGILTSIKFPSGETLNNITLDGSGNLSSGVYLDLSGVEWTISGGLLSKRKDTQGNQFLYNAGILTEIINTTGDRILYNASQKVTQVFWANGTQAREITSNAQDGLVNAIMFSSTFAAGTVLSDVFPNMEPRERALVNGSILTPGASQGTVNPFFAFTTGNNWRNSGPTADLFGGPNDQYIRIRARGPRATYTVFFEGPDIQRTYTFPSSTSFQDLYIPLPAVTNNAIRHIQISPIGGLVIDTNNDPAIFNQLGVSPNVNLNVAVPFNGLKATPALPAQIATAFAQKANLENIAMMFQ